MRCLVFCFAIAPVAICSSLGFSPARAADITSPRIGDVRTVAKNTVCPKSRSDLDKLIKALVAKDEDGYKEVGMRSAILSKGDHVRIIDRAGFLGSEKRLRVLSGDAKGEACWVPTDLDMVK
jgi:hypothetical protein